MQSRFAAFTGGVLRRVERTDPVRLVLLGYLSYVLLGWALLCLPGSHTPAGVAASALDHLFTATSAVSTTGLSTRSTADDYSFAGQLVILLLIQSGGLGYMSLGSFVVLAWSGRLSPLRHRIGGAVLALPPGFDIARFLRVMVTFTLLVEAAGAVALHTFVFGPAGTPGAVWQSIFHSVSAFCTAGFGLFNDSFEAFRGHLPLNLIIGLLSYLGAVGFIVVHDVWHSIARRRAHVTFTTRIIVLSSLAVMAAGTVLTFFDEPALRALPTAERWLAAWFQVTSASTTVGFNTVPIGALSASSLLLLAAIMVIGASPAGTGGGLKTTTCTALWAVMTAVIRRRAQPQFLGREIPSVRVRTAVAGALFYLITLGVGLYVLTLCEETPLGDLAFEAASALGTVGLSRGITAGLSPAGKAVLVALMFIGRVGPLAFGMAFFRTPAALPRQENAGAESTPVEEDLIL